MLVCKKCGAENPLGRVFCGGCGSKLDLSDMTRDSVAESIRPNAFVAHWRKVVLAVVILVVALVGLAFWPRTAYLGEKGNTIGSARAMRQFNALARLREGRMLEVTLTEKDLNGYIEYRKIRRTPVRMCSVDIRPRAVQARLVRKIGSWPLGPVKLEPTLSYDVTCAMMGGQLVVVSAAIGHLKVFGPLKRMAVQPFLRLFADGPESDVLRAASEITLDGDEAVIKVGG